MELLKLSKVYALTEMEDNIFQCLADNVQFDNFFTIFEAVPNFLSQREYLLQVSFVSSALIGNNLFNVF